MHKFGVPQGGVLFGRVFPPLGRGGYPPRGGSGTPPRGAPPTRGGGGGTPPPPLPGGVGGVPRNPEKWVFGTPPWGGHFASKMVPTPGKILTGGPSKFGKCPYG